MLTIPLKVYIIFSLLFLSHTIIPIKDRKFKWQIHSFNDPRELKQLIRKSNNLFKIDLFYVPHDSCYTNNILSKNNKLGCFLLTHDKPNNNILYPTIYDYIDEILKYKSHFQSTEFISDLALCFKNSPKDLCKQDSKQWIKLVDSLYNYIDKIFNENKLKIQIVYDGKKWSCILDKWPKWIYTWIRNRDPDKAFFYDDSDSDKHYDKFAVFNDAVITLYESSLLNWGKFKNKKRPLQLWEVNKQKDILYFAKMLIENPHKGGYAYAINIDQSMFQVYSAMVSRENYNINIIKKPSFSMKYSVFTIVENKYIFFFNSKNKVIIIFTIEAFDVKKIKTFKNKNLPKGELIDCIYIGILKQRYYIILNNKEGEFALFSISMGFDKVDIWIESIDSAIKNYNGDLNNNNDFIDMTGLSLVSFDAISQSNITNENNVDLIVAFTLKNKNNIIYIVNFSLWLDIQKFEMKTHYKQLNLTEELFGLNIKCYVNKCIVITREGEKDSIYSHLLSYNQSEFNIILSPWKNFGVGENFALSIISKGEKQKFLFVKDNAFCYHTEKSNKNANVLVCSQKEVKKNHVLNYIYGDIRSDSDENDFYSSVCSKEVITGSYDMGNYPKVKMFIDERGEIDFIEMHDGIRNYFDIDQACGISNFYDGIVLDNWNVGDVEVKE